MLTKKQYEILKGQEKHLKTAHSGYVRGMYTTDAEALKQIYMEVCKGDNLNIHCGSCLLRMCNALYEEMNKYEKKYEKESSGNTSSKQPKARGKAKADKRADNSGKE